MTKDLTGIDQDKAPSKKRGTLFLLVGPSGSGKGPLLKRLKDSYENDDRCVFPKRVITRAVNMPEEEHIHATQESFSNAEEGDAFLFHWHTHGHKYGIPGHAYMELLAGRHVFLNVSRTIVEQARALYSPLVVFHIETELNTSFKRLKERGRESEEEIAQRLKRHDLPYPDGPDVIRIEKDGETDDAYQQADKVIQQILEPTS